MARADHPAQTFSELNLATLTSLVGLLFYNILKKNTVKKVAKQNVYTYLVAHSHEAKAEFLFQK